MHVCVCARDHTELNILLYTNQGTYVPKGSYKTPFGVMVMVLINQESNVCNVQMYTRLLLMLLK